ncbi:hypothetical protein [Aquimarina intermedia]|uniref:Uncharacterized protein n=1 Tax=Aquimarina intermedia TaxID=350814 RepID=A0A5S5CBW3_9FLAO|nr:hypothetical protein [Aquimarina intermedia]TYP76861.1 hypothetical protein BD809_1016 [Aquimarina intermedia]
MKKNYFLVILLMCGLRTFSQWTDYGTKIATSDSVGIGISTSLSKLHVAVDEDALTWPVIINNNRNSSIVTKYGVGIELKHSWNHENWKWGV